MDGFEVTRRVCVKLGVETRTAAASVASLRLRLRLRQLNMAIIA